MLKKFLIASFILLCAQLGFSQLSKTHYIPPLTSAELGNAYPENQYIYLSTPTATSINYTIKPIGQPASNYITGTVSNTTPIEIPIGTGNGQLFIASSTTSTVINNAGYIIEAEDLIYVSVRMEAGNAQAGALVSKGMAALGNTFRIGSYTNENPQDNYLNFASVMATEDNTQVTFSDLPTGLIIKNYTGITPITTTLNEGESYIVAINSFDSSINTDGLIGALVEADKPVVVNCGSANGSFHNGGGRDYGIDQIVGLSKVGNEYIFVKGDGTNDWENVLLVPHSFPTDVFINGNLTPITINATDRYLLIEGAEYNSNGNMYVETTEDVFAYQGVGATTSEANQGMFFVPPLSCETRGNLDNIANIEKIGTEIYTGGISIVTKTGSTVTVNGQPILNFTTSGPHNVDGKIDYVTYKVTGLTGNISVESTDELYCAYFNYNGAATSGSFYSGFPTPPEINFDAAFVTLGICIPNVKLEVANMGNFDSIEWYYDDGSGGGFSPTGNNSIQFTPTASGTYKLIGKLNCSGLTLESLEVPVSICPDDIDNDGIIDNLDIDNDNDGILNCTESYGNEDVNLSNLNSGSLSVGGYTYTGTHSTIGNSAATPFIGDSDGTILSEVPNKIGTLESSATYTLTFNNNLNLQFEYATSTSLGNGLLTNDEEFIIQVPNTRTITLVDPDDQLLVDTNYDGIYETGITQISSFEIRFKLNGASLNIGSGTFKFVANSVKSITYKHKNNSDSTDNQATFKISATCIPKDNDNDTIQDALDFDSDNDGIPDYIEVNGINNILSGIDADANGLDDIYSLTATPKDSDNDGVWDFYDLDSDNDGITDLIETGQLGLLSDTDLNGVIDWLDPSDTNGWDNNAETAPDSGIIGYILDDLDSDLEFSYYDLDSDGDNCSDVIEAGFSDGNNNDLLGDSIVTVNSNGLVNNASDGYTLPNSNYNTTGIITIIDQPVNQTTCNLETTTFTVNTNTVDGYQWQVSNDNGINWSNISNNTTYSNVSTNQLIITNTPGTFNNHQYRVFIEKTNNSCGLYSNEVTLTVNPLPTITSPVFLTQCDNDVDGFSAFNLTEVNAEISTNYLNETITFYETEAEALVGTPAITNPTLYTNQTVNSDTVWARVETNAGCALTSEIQLFVSTTGIPSTFQRTFNVCDDFLNATENDRDGISTFNFSSVDAEVRSIFPVGQLLTIKYYRNETDALAETNEIADISNYRNIGYPNSQQIYIRVDSQIDNDCLGFGDYITLNVEELPTANSVTINRQCDDNTDGMYPFDVSSIESTVLSGQTNVTVTYFDELGNSLPSPLPNPFLTATQTISIRVTNNVTADPNGACFDETSLEFIVDAAPVANPVTITPVCDDESNDGVYDFDTSTIQSTLLGTQTFNVSYFDELGNPLPSPLPNPFTTSTQTINVEVINPANTTCVANTTIDFIVNPLPDFKVESPQTLCLTNPQEFITLDVIQQNTSEILDYEWRKKTDLSTLLSTNSTLNVNEAGIYEVSLTKTDGSGCARTREIEVIYSEVAKIDIDDITIVDDSDNNTVTINNSSNNLGVGDYIFALDDGFFQDEPFFDYVSPGFHTIHIEDKNGCMPIVSIEISVIGYPKFFTPNGDGLNDTWQIQGVNENFYSNSKIYIFNRFGKLITKIDPKGEGWNGTYNGQYMPSSDYWFSVELIDNAGNVRIKKGHFSLIRQ